jgi:hypothetical protein
MISQKKLRRLCQANRGPKGIRFTPKFGFLAKITRLDGNIQVVAGC